MKKLILMLGILLFFAGSVIALTSLTNEIKVEKVGDVLEVWKKTVTYTIDQVSLRSDEITSEVIKIQSEGEYWKNNFYPACIKDCPMMCKEMELEKNWEICIDQCPFECENQKNLMVDYNNQRINELNNEKELFSTAIK